MFLGSNYSVTLEFHQRNQNRMIKQKWDTDVSRLEFHSTTEGQSSRNAGRVSSSSTSGSV